ncbi:MAG: hypothetical protein IPK19_17485 [Chloroflexi bacterium]|nr:hypothetical protein [Chloroflexota bacterium]
MKKTPSTKEIADAGGDFQTQPGLAHAARAGQRHQSDLARCQQIPHSGGFRLAPDQRRHLSRQIVRNAARRDLSRLGELRRVKKLPRFCR